MANSETTTPTTRRAILTGIAATAVAGAALAVPPAAAATTDVDAVLAAWRTWHALGTERERLCAEMVEIFERFPEHVSKPRVLLLEGKVSKKQWYATTVEEIVQYYSGHEDIMTPAQITQRQARRDAKVAELQGAKAIAEAEMQRTTETALCGVVQGDRCLLRHYLRGHRLKAVQQGILYARRWPRGAMARDGARRHSLRR